MAASRDIEMGSDDEGATFKWVEAYAQDLEEPSQTGRTKADWDTLRHIIKCRINHNITKYLTRTPRPRTNPLISASSIDSFASDHPHQPELHRPSTQGGLILPPWPPKSPRLRNGVEVGASGTVSTTEGGQTRALFCGPGEPMMDDDAAIGGRTLSANLNDEEARLAKQRIYRLLDGFEEDPPFTIQRVCELALNPTASHKFLGKYLRALEKVLLVTSNWDPLPSSSPVQSNSSTRMYSQSSGLYGSESPHSSTPLFSPIPFLMRNGSAEPEHFRLDGGGPNDPVGHNVNPMSLNLDIGSDHSATVRPPTSIMDSLDDHPPNPLLIATANSGASSSNSGESGDHHDSFMGRVDELDSGPLSPLPTNASTSTSPRTSSANPSNDRQFAEGTGESGNMIPHGMSERPQAISSTTTLSPVRSEGSERTPSPPSSWTSGRKVSRMPRTASMGNLSDRFVKAEVLSPAEMAHGKGLQTPVNGDHEREGDNGTAAGGATKVRRVE